MQMHFKESAMTIQDRFEYSFMDKVLEIGSNSGIFIKHFNPDTSIAVEPCSNFADITNDMGYKTYDEFWGEELSKRIRQEHGTFDFIFSANTISHIQGLGECLNGVRRCLSDDGVFVVECPSFLELLKGNAFDQFYHEHQSYFSVISFRNLLERNGLKLFDVEQRPVHGGTYRFFICKDKCHGTRCLPTDNLNKYEEMEKKFGVDSYDTLKDVMDTMKRNMIDIKRTLQELKSNGKKVVGYGATAKFTQVSNMCGLNSDIVDYVLDTTPDKQNKYVPKSKIKIIAYDDKSLDGIDYCFLGAWNYKDEILQKEQNFIRNGGKFITHIPSVSIGYAKWAPQGNINEFVVVWTK